MVGIGSVILSAALFTMLFDVALHYTQLLPRGLMFLAPVQQSGSAWSVEVANVVDEVTFWSAVAQAWPAVLALVAFAYAFIRTQGASRTACVVLGWTLLAWATLCWPNGAPSGQPSGRSRR